MSNSSSHRPARQPYGGNIGLSTSQSMNFSRKSFAATTAASAPMSRSASTNTLSSAARNAALQAHTQTSHTGSLTSRSFRTSSYTPAARPGYQSLRDGSNPITTLRTSSMRSNLSLNRTLRKSSGPPSTKRHYTPSLFSFDSMTSEPAITITHATPVRGAPTILEEVSTEPIIKHKPPARALSPSKSAMKDSSSSSVISGATLSPAISTTAPSTKKKHARVSFSNASAMVPPPPQPQFITPANSPPNPAATATSGTLDHVAAADAAMKSIGNAEKTSSAKLSSNGADIFTLPSTSTTSIGADSSTSYDTANETPATLVNTSDLTSSPSKLTEKSVPTPVLAHPIPKTPHRLNGILKKDPSSDHAKKSAAAALHRPASANPSAGTRTSTVSNPSGQRRTASLQPQAKTPQRNSTVRKSAPKTPIGALPSEANGMSLINSTTIYGSMQLRRSNSDSSFHRQRTVSAQDSLEFGFKKYTTPKSANSRRKTTAATHVNGNITNNLKGINSQGINGAIRHDFTDSDSDVDVPFRSEPAKSSLPILASEGLRHSQISRPNGVANMKVPDEKSAETKKINVKKTESSTLSVSDPTPKDRGFDKLPSFHPFRIEPRNSAPVVEPPVMAEESSVSAEPEDSNKAAAKIESPAVKTKPAPTKSTAPILAPRVPVPALESGSGNSDDENAISPARSVAHREAALDALNGVSPARVPVPANSEPQQAPRLESQLGSVTTASEEASSPVRTKKLSQFQQFKLERAQKKEAKSQKKQTQTAAKSGTQAKASSSVPLAQLKYQEALGSLPDNVRSLKVNDIQFPPARKKKFPGLRRAFGISD
ncbi:uncharacterized protein V1516DRAFT_667499 [Lipomyces oligophaga]|uniref:uncharacterized protein n=1 Tax=Lipomyces oligophaga TaxID=45792 RepID=UPI0034D00677